MRDSKPRVLAIEDDVAIRRGVVSALTYVGFEVLEAGDGLRGIELGVSESVDLVLLDLVLPGRDGLEVLGELRRHDPTLPIIIVTARGDESERVRGLELGADDYVVKPFSARELIARVEAVLRRSPERPAPVRSVACDGVEVDFERQEARGSAGESVPLSSLETDVLKYLAARPGRVISRDELLNRVWEARAHHVASRAVDMTVARLRKKLRQAGAPELLSTVKGKGYKLQRPPGGIEGGGTR